MISPKNLNPFPRSDAARRNWLGHWWRRAGMLALLLLMFGAHTAHADGVDITIINKSADDLARDINTARQKLGLTLPTHWPAGHGLFVSIWVDQSEEAFVRPLVDVMVKGRDFDDEYQSIIDRLVRDEWQLEIMINHEVLNRMPVTLAGGIYDFDQAIGPAEAAWKAGTSRTINEEGQRIFDSVVSALGQALDKEMKSKTGALRRKFAIKMALSTVELAVGATLLGAVPFSFGATIVFAAIAISRSLSTLGQGVWETIQKSDKQLAEAGACLEELVARVGKLDSTKSRAKEVIGALIAGADIPVHLSTVKSCKEKVETAHRKVCSKFYRLVGQVARVRDGVLPSDAPVGGKLIEMWNQVRVSSAQKEIDKSLLKAKDGLLTLGNKCKKISDISRHLDRLRDEHMTTTRMGEWTERATRLAFALGTIIAGGIYLDSYVDTLADLNTAANAAASEIEKYTALVAKYAIEIPVTTAVYVGEVMNDEL